MGIRPLPRQAAAAAAGRDGALQARTDNQTVIFARVLVTQPSEAPTPLRHVSLFPITSGPAKRQAHPEGPSGSGRDYAPHALRHNDKCSTRHGDDADLTTTMPDPCFKSVPP